MRNTSKMFLGMALMCMMLISHLPTDKGNSALLAIGTMCICLFVAVPEKE